MFNLKNSTKNTFVYFKSKKKRKRLKLLVQLYNLK